MVHRDIQPANILLENGIKRVKITDFGLARAVDDIGMTQTGTIAGTPQYMSPEQGLGNAIDERSEFVQPRFRSLHTMHWASPFSGRLNSLRLSKECVTTNPEISAM